MKRTLHYLYDVAFGALRETARKIGVTLKTTDTAAKSFVEALQAHLATICGLECQQRPTEQGILVVETHVNDDLLVDIRNILPK